MAGLIDVPNADGGPEQVLVLHGWKQQATPDFGRRVRNDVRNFPIIIIGG